MALVEPSLKFLKVLAHLLATSLTVFGRKLQASSTKSAVGFPITIHSKELANGLVALQVAVIKKLKSLRRPLKLRMFRRRTLQI